MGSTRKDAKLSQESCKIESQEGNQSTTSKSSETYNNKVEFASKEESSTSEFLQTQTVAEEAKKDDIWKQQKTESTLSSLESTQTVTTSTQNIMESSEQKLNIVKTKSLLEKDAMVKGEEVTEALPKP